LKLDELNNVGELVTQNLASDAQVIMGARINKEFNGRVRVITIITGVKSPYVLGKPTKEFSPRTEMGDLGIEVYR